MDPRGVRFLGGVRREAGGGKMDSADGGTVANSHVLA